MTLFRKKNFYFLPGCYGFWTTVRAAVVIGVVVGSGTLVVDAMAEMRWSAEKFGRVVG